MEPRDVLAGLFRRVGQRARGDDIPEEGGGGDALGGLMGQVEEFITMPVDLAVLLIDASTEMATLVLDTLAKAGYVVVKGTTPL